MKNYRDFDIMRARIIAGIISDRDFDIPVEIYDELNSEVVILLLDDKMKYLGNKQLLDNYVQNENEQGFFKYVRECVKHTDALFQILRFSKHSAERLLFFSGKEWAKLAKVDIKTVMNDLNLALEIPELNDVVLLIIISVIGVRVKSMGYINETKLYDTYLRSIDTDNFNVKSAVKLAYLLGFNEDYNETLNCLNNGIPVLYKKFSLEDPLTIVMYLQTVLASGYNGILDDNISDQLIEYYTDYVDDDLDFSCIKMLYEIGVTLNHNNLKYFHKVINLPISTDEFIKELNMPTLKYGKFDYNYTLTPYGYIKNFKVITEILGKSNTGYSPVLQTLFIKRGGDIETMFDENGKLLPEASIIRTRDSLGELLRILSVDQIRFLLLNSPEFVSNIITADWQEMTDCINIAKALMVIPLDENLWSVINNDNLDKPLDYRMMLISKIRSFVPLNILYEMVPETMAYIEPSVVYISRFMTLDKMTYPPAHRLIPYLKRYIGNKSKYKRINLYEKGDYASILSAVGDDYQFMISNIVNGGKYGYICDMKVDNISELIDAITRLTLEGIEGR